MSAPKCERANTVTNDESMPPDSWQPTLTSLRSCEATLRRISVIEPIDRLFAGEPRLLDSVGNRPVARGRDAVRRDRQAMAGAQLAHAFQQRRLAGHIAKRQLLVDVVVVDLPP